MTGCSAINCSNRAEQGYALKVFPRDPKRRALWAAKVKRLNWVPTNKSYLCEVHFAADQWEQNRADGKRKLKPNAIPTIFSFTPTQKKRKEPIERNVEENKKLKLTVEDCNPQIEKLQQELIRANNVIINLKQENAILKHKLRQKVSLISKLKRSARKASKPYREIFNEDQLQAIYRKSMAFQKWSNKTVETALGLKFSCGVRGYENLLHLQLPYPSNRTLRRRLQNLKFRPGILYEVLEFLKIKVNSFEKEQERCCALLLDEMAITEGVEYDIANKTYFGEVSFPGQKGRANHALVFMLGGLSTRWKQVIAYHFTNGQADGSTMKEIIIEIIKETEKIGLNIVSITSDMGPCNQAMWKSFGITAGRHAKTECSITHPCDAARSIHFIADVPHLIKRIRSSLLTHSHYVLPEEIQNRYNLPTPIVNPKHLEDLAKFQENMELKLAPKLTPEHLNNAHFDKMKVSRATNVVSHDVSVALKLFADEKGDESIITTSWFIKTIDKWFNLMTSHHPVMALSRNNAEKYLESLTFLEEIIDIFQNIKIINAAGKALWKPIQTGIILSTTAILNLQAKLLNEKEFHFILTSRFSQDSLENLFSLIRSKQVIPTALQFKNNLKLVIVAQYLKNSSTGSYDDDSGKFLSGILDVVQVTPSKDIPKIILPRNWDMCQSSLTTIEENCLYNISGYIMSRIHNKSNTCSACFSMVATQESNNAACAKLVSLKEKKDGCLFYVLEDIFYSLFCRLELLFRCLETHLLKDIGNCNVFLKEKINEDEKIKAVSLPDCHGIKQKILNYFVTFRLKIFSLKKNKYLAQLSKKKSKPELSSKSSAMRDLANRI